MGGLLRKIFNFSKNRRGHPEFPLAMPLSESINKNKERKPISKWKDVEVSNIPQNIKKIRFVLDENYLLFK
jgi:hypothetical protein